MRRASLIGMWLLALAGPPLVAAEPTDPAVLAARRALAAGHAVAALQVLESHPARRAPGEVALLVARASLQLGRAGEAIDALALGTVDDLGRWPERQRGAAAAVMGEGVLAVGRLADARTWLETALRLRDPALETDRILVLLAEVCSRLDDPKTAERAALLVWRDWPRSSHRARAGLIAARLQATSRPDDARALLAGVRTLDQVEPATHLAAAELLCHLLLASKPGQCLVVAEQDGARLNATGRLPLYRALALGALEPREGLAALSALPEPLRQDPAALAAQRRWSASDSAVQDDTLRIEHARAHLELGRPVQARALLEPLAATRPAALILLAQIPDIALGPWLTCAAMNDPVARASVAIALAQRGEHAVAWPLFVAVLEQGTPSGIASASLWFWAARCAARVAPTREGELRQQILRLAGDGVEIGITWAEEAQRREQIGADPAQVQLAWQRAGLALPAHHAWQPSAILRAAKALTSNVPQWTQARDLLERVTAQGGGEDRLRCRFLLLQVYEQLGQFLPALALVDELMPVASAEQAEKLARIRLRLNARSESEVQPGPLDAEN